MRPKTLLVMFILMAALGGFIFFYEKDRPSTDELRELEKKVLGVSKDDVEALTISWEGQDAAHHLRLERQDPPAEEGAEDDVGGFTPRPTWRLVEPFEARADRAQVDRLLTSLTGLEHRRVLDQVDRDNAGLTNPEVRVTITTAEGDTELLFGAELPASGDRFAAIAGRDGAYVVGSALVGDLKKEPGAWRDKRLFTGTRSKIERVTLEQAGERLVLARHGEDFRVESPFTDQADDERINTLITAITGLTVTTFLDEPLLDPGSMGLEPAGAILEVIWQGADQPFRLELGQGTGGEDGLRYGSAEGELFELDAGLDELFAASPASWRSRDWASLQVFQIDSATFTDASGSTTIRREGAEWFRDEDKVEYSVASDLLYAVTDAEAERVLSDADASGTTLAEPDLTIVLASEEEEETLYLYGTDAGAMAAREDREAILALSAEASEEIRLKLEAVREAEVLVEEEEEEEEEEGEGES